MKYVGKSATGGEVYKKGIEEDFKQRLLDTARSWLRSGIPGKEGKPDGDEVVDYMKERGSTMGRGAEQWLRDQLR